MVVALVKVGVGAFGLVPVGPEDLAPPGGIRHAAGGGMVGGQEEVEDVGPAEPFGFGDVASGGNELGELGVRNGRFVQPKPIHPHLPHRPFAVGRERRVAAAHEERTAVEPHHVVGVGGVGGGWVGWRNGRFSTIISRRRTATFLCTHAGDYQQSAPFWQSVVRYLER